MATERQYFQDPIEWPTDVPAGFCADPLEPAFDPAVHLQIEPPTTVKTLDFKTKAFPYTAETKAAWPGLAYTAPFRLLSKDGVKLIRTAVERNMHLLHANERIPACIRGLGYQSKAVRDLTYCPEVMGLLDDLANTRLSPHGIHMNIGHTNMGKVKTGRNVDKWHTDSVDYVYVLILSDITDMKGGELQVLQLPDARGHTFEKLTVEGVPADLIETASYVEAGYVMFMQGSKILHQVTPVLAAREPRLSFVNSFASCNVFGEDRTRYHTSAHQDPTNVAPLEFARHTAWRGIGQLRYLLDLPFGVPDSELSSVLKRAAKDLLAAGRLIAKEDNDKLAFLPDGSADDDAATSKPRSKL